MFAFIWRKNRRRTAVHQPKSRFRPYLEAMEACCLPSGGALAPTFGTGGVVTTNTGVFSDSFAYAVATYPAAGTANDGKIVAAGVVLSKQGTDIGVARYNLDGTLDPSFAGSGLLTTNLGTRYEGASDVKIQPDGKVLAAGWPGGSGSDFVLLRYNADGSLDTSFGRKGEVITDFNRSTDLGERLALQPDGKLVVAGTSNGDLALVRYNADGSL